MLCSEFLFLFFSFLSPTPAPSPALQSQSLASGSHFRCPLIFFFCFCFCLFPPLSSFKHKRGEMGRNGSPFIRTGGHQKCLMHYNEKRHLYSHKAFSVPHPASLSTFILSSSVSTFSHTPPHLIPLLPQTSNTAPPPGSLFSCHRKSTLFSARLPGGLCECASAVT